MDQKKVADLRKDYRLNTLEKDNLQKNWLAQFDWWFKEALAADLQEPNAMILATANKQGRPSARTVLLKAYDERGLIFYSNYDSRKGREIKENPFAALVFNWLQLQRQIRVNGSIVKLTKEESEQYFKSRPKGSQIGAWASPQSSVIPDRQLLEAKVVELNEKYKDEDSLPIPDNWGGYLVQPESIEFWQGRTSRLHDRLIYKKNKEGNWDIQRLAP